MKDYWETNGFEKCFNPYNRDIKPFISDSIFPFINHYGLYMYPDPINSLDYLLYFIFPQDVYIHDDENCKIYPKNIYDTINHQNAEPFEHLQKNSFCPPHYSVETPLIVE